MSWWTNRGFFDDPAAARIRDAENERVSAENAAENAKYDDLTTDELRQLATKQMQDEAAKEALEARNHEIRRLFATTPELPCTVDNVKQLETGLRTYLKRTGRKWPNWKRTDIERVSDILAEEGMLQLNGRWVRKTPTAEQLSETPIHADSSEPELIEALTRNHEGKK